MMLSRCWADWECALMVVKPETVIRWHRRAFRWYLWTFATPMLRYFHCQRSRALKVAEEVLGKDFTGLIVSDF
jgi:hypothetical protein